MYHVFLEALIDLHLDSETSHLSQLESITLYFTCWILVILATTVLYWQTAIPCTHTKLDATHGSSCKKLSVGHDASSLFGTTCSGKQDHLEHLKQYAGDMQGSNAWIDYNALVTGHGDEIKQKWQMSCSFRETTHVRMI